MDVLASASNQSSPPDRPEQGRPEFVFTHDPAGRYVSFQWHEAAAYGLDPMEVVGASMETSFGPVAIAPYLGRVRRVLDYLTPEEFQVPFHYGDRYFLLELVVSPVLSATGKSSLVWVTGHKVDESTTPIADPLDTLHPPLLSHSGRYQKLLTQIAWNIRRTLDLETIWHQTVNGLGQALGVSRCIICPCRDPRLPIRVVAEYRQQPFRSLLDHQINIAEMPHLQEALANLTPTVLYKQQAGQDEDPLCERQAVLTIATCYQDQPNGFIILQHCIPVDAPADTPLRIWNEAELGLVQELADQVGTAIAHATLFSESQALARELQRVNEDLIHKHQELEEARQQAEEARQQAEEASRLKSEFLANTSHELRTPLNGMLGFLKLVMDGMAEDPEEQHEFIDEAYRSALHLLNIINDILDIAKIEAGKMELELTPVKLEDLLNAVEDFTRPQAQQKDLSFRIVTPATHDEIILYGNYQRLLQVMLNLVGNAIKFTHEGGITISAEVIKQPVVIQKNELPGLVKVRVADTGIGVSLDKQYKLFQSFSQVDGSRTRQYGGTGLGLTISQKLVEAMGGEVNFFSLGEGLGSTVTFTVPIFQLPLLIASGA